MSLPEPRHTAPVVRRDAEVHSVTTAQTGLSEEQRTRAKRYLISMSIRTVCFLGVIVTDGWVRWALVAGAVVLPYVAVVMANAGRENDDFDAPEAVTPVTLPRLEGPRPGIGG